jgi:hypothetical protein
MANQESREKPQRDMTAKVGERHGGEGKPHAPQSPVKPGGTVGRDVPDESKEHHTEIAVEAGRTGREHADDKR